MRSRVRTSHAGARPSPPSVRSDRGPRSRGPEERGASDASAATPRRAILLDELERGTRTSLAGLEDDALVERDIPIDWLRLYEAIGRVEARLGVEVEEDALARVRTLGDLHACVADAEPRRR